MKEIFDYISIKEYEEKTKQIKDGQTINLYSSNIIKIRLKKRGSKLYTVIVRYGEEDISNIARNLLLQI
ncbi:hypothetical protein [Clostridium thermobutyricum]|uniref:hypothetical protein n=1 Tax=Clostridium thermobutyricum TaxID=29372 RepID=UPI0018AAD2FB|nr:hypothetical protein [Clostridium thermobutyricum]